MGFALSLVMIIVASYLFINKDGLPNIDIKKLSPKFILAIIDRWKNKGFMPENVSIKKGFFWIEGYWKWSLFYGTYLWVDGYWERERMDYHWHEGYWEETPDGFFWIDGYWCDHY